MTAFNTYISIIHQCSISVSVNVRYYGTVDSIPYEYRSK